MSGAALRLVTAPGPGAGAAALLPAPVRYPGREALTELETESLRAHRSRHGPRPRCRPGDGVDLPAAVAAAGVTGRGGGHVPAATKWAAARGASVVVANGAESEPGSRKDVALLELRPHLVLDGLACVAEALGAAETVVWVHGTSTAALQALDRALAERRAARSTEPAVRVVAAPERYLSGESSAVARGVAGGPALPVFRRHPGDAVAGVRTLVHNVETLARIALVARGRTAGDTVLISVRDRGCVTVLEVPRSTSLRAALHRAVGDAGMQAVLVGGYGGSWVPIEQGGDLPLDESALRSAGVSLGAGVLEILGAGECGVARTAAIAAYLAREGARQCGPCLFGLDALAGSTAALAAGRRSRREAARIGAHLAAVGGRGACHHPDGAVRMIASALRTFDADVAAHLKGRCLHPRDGERRRAGQ